MPDQLDPTDQKILQLLQQDARLSHKDIGLRVHRTGQAVGQRINRLQDLGLIEKYTIQIKYPHTQFIRLFMQNNHFTAFENFISQQQQVSACYKTSGAACYMIKTHLAPAEFNHFIEQLSQWGHYTVDTVVKEINDADAT